MHDFRHWFFLIAMLFATFAPEQATGDGHARTSSKNDPAACLEHLQTACDQGVKAVRNMIARTGVTIHLVTLDYQNHTDSAIHSRVVKPAQLEEPREICGAFDGKGTDHYSQQCRPGERKGTIECDVRDGSDEYTLTFRTERGVAKLVAMTGRIEN